MQKSFSIVEDEDDLQEDVSDDVSVMEKYINKTKDLPANHLLSKISSAGPSGISKRSRTKKSLSSESDLDESDIDEELKNQPSGQYNPKDYEMLDVSSEIKEIFQYITKYVPQDIQLDYKFKPFIPEFIPAVGDIDAFLKVIPPVGLISETPITTDAQLGLTVLDEPAANQSDPALLHLQLRAESAKTTDDSDVIVKKINNVEKNNKVIDKWIKDISALHKSKSFPAVYYTESMPDLDELMQQWPEQIENQLKEDGFPEPGGNLEEYIDKVCGMFGIPTTNKIEALHVLFALYAAIKSSQLFTKTQNENVNTESLPDELDNVADRLLLE